MSDLIDRRFGRLTVIALDRVHISPSGTKRKMWKCKCDCGNEIIVSTSNLNSGNTKSCGCLRDEKLVSRHIKHGKSRQNNESRLYKVWKNMKRRCNSPNDKRYASYGGRGIKVCEEWSNSYADFEKWAYDNGYDENAIFGDCTLDRIDNNGNYEPNNCRWVNKITQANNTRKNKYIDFMGQKITIAEFARIMKISPNHAWYYTNKYERSLKNGE